MGKFSDDFKADTVSITIDDIKELLRKVSRSLKDKNPYLKPVEGFFFGSTEYDDWYWDDCKELVKEVDSIISSHKEGDQYTYINSW